LRLGGEREGWAGGGFCVGEIEVEVDTCRVLAHGRQNATLILNVLHGVAHSKSAIIDAALNVQQETGTHFLEKTRRIQVDVK
jgi:hypothetical protein